MRSVKKLNPVVPNERLGIELLNSIIDRIEYSAQIIQAYELVQGQDIITKQLVNGIQISTDGIYTYDLGVSVTSVRIALTTEYNIITSIVWTVIQYKKGVRTFNPISTYSVRTFFEALNLNSQKLTEFSNSASFNFSLDNELNPYSRYNLSAKLLNAKLETIKEASALSAGFSETITLADNGLDTNDYPKIGVAVTFNLINSYIKLFINNEDVGLLEKKGLNSWINTYESEVELDSTAYAEIWWGNNLLDTSNSIIINKTENRSVSTAYGPPDGGSEAYVLLGQTVYFENIGRNNNGNFGLIYVAGRGKERVLQIWNSNGAKDDRFNIYLNGKFLSSILFDFNEATGAIYKTSGWDEPPVGNIVGSAPVYIVEKSDFLPFPL